MSVCPSVTCRCCVETAKLVIRHFHCWVATPFWCFSTKPYGNTLMRIPLTGALNADRVCKSRDFRSVSHFILEMIRDSAIVIWNACRNCYVICRMVPFQMTLNDPSPAFKVERVRGHSRSQKWYEIDIVTMEYLIGTYTCPTQGSHFE